MTQGVARLGDLTTGVCSHPSHAVPLPTSGKIITASDTVFADNLPVARLGDTVLADCGHSSIIITSATTVDSNTRGNARLNDQVGNGPYSATIITASTTVTAT